MTHSPEPWTVEDYNSGCGFVRDANNQDIHYGYYDQEMPPANAERIVACVNALQGIENPQEFVEEAKELLKYGKVYTGHTIQQSP